MSASPQTIAVRLEALSGAPAAIVRKCSASLDVSAEDALAIGRSVLLRGVPLPARGNGIAFAALAAEPLLDDTHSRDNEPDRHAFGRYRFSNGSHDRVTPPMESIA